MPEQRNTRASGFIIAASIMIGFFVGASQGQMSAGFIGGLVVGSAIAVALWLVERRR